MALQETSAKIDVLIATPSHSGQVHIGYMNSWFRTVLLLASKGFTCESAFMQGNALITSARNILAQDFLDSTADTLLFIDSDLSWRPEDALRLVQSPHDVIAGVYPAKCDEIKWLAKFKPGQTRLLEADGLPGGFLKISRRALEKLSETVPQYDYRGRKMYAFFETAIVDGEYLGEDYAFTHRWKQTGEKAFIDPDCTFEHFGHKAWSGNLNDYLQSVGPFDSYAP